MFRRSLAVLLAVLPAVALSQTPPARDALDRIRGRRADGGPELLHRTLPFRGQVGEVGVDGGGFRIHAAQATPAGTASIRWTPTNQRGTEDG